MYNTMMGESQKKKDSVDTEKQENVPKKQKISRRDDKSWMSKQQTRERHINGERCAD